MALNAHYPNFLDETNDSPLPTPETVVDALAKVPDVLPMPTTPSGRITQRKCLKKYSLTPDESALDMLLDNSFPSANAAPTMSASKQGHSAGQAILAHHAVDALPSISTPHCVRERLPTPRCDGNATWKCGED
ncbi:uncharacterized protein MELLADRAFT_60351 [Melampsora larici-populina 98AG31]|uniref:Uncharacterized protein n=1 Tax=Melampsora larici-populina (strain 98AG31 / pathotype 3-4-7) TaxID=747676 RepID=F4RB08_MELLP|nr:uncharacterized protein MELLADRAFT_60351 [Melampsora larici-populina 98AG31]EGG10683.1 hypothetical protein MELLADRAFT_60351 [Melampsora larici-populina 98AG31]